MQEPSIPDKRRRWLGVGDRTATRRERLHEDQLPFQSVALLSIRSVI